MPVKGPAKKGGKLPIMPKFESTINEFEEDPVPHPKELMTKKKKAPVLSHDEITDVVSETIEKAASQIAIKKSNVQKQVLVAEKKKHVQKEA